MSQQHNSINQESTTLNPKSIGSNKNFKIIKTIQFLGKRLKLSQPLAKVINLNI